MKYDSEGRRLLVDIFGARGEQARVARETKSDPGHLSHISKGNTRPGLRLAFELQRVCGIPAESWQRKPKKKHERPTPNPMRNTGT